MSTSAVIAWIAVIVAIDGIAALVGGLLPDRMLHRLRPAMLGFAAGTLLGSGALDVLPEAFARSGSLSLAWAAGAFVALGVFEWATSRRSAHAASPVNPIALLGSDALHNFGDGMAIAAAFLVSPRLGLFTSIAVIVHELPEELADYALLRTSGMSRRRALASLALVQLTSGLGAAVALAASHSVAGVEGIVLALASGMFLYIALVDLLPEVIRTRNRLAWVAFGAGGVLAVFAP